MAWTAPKTDFDPGDVLTAAEMNAIGENLDAIGGAWTAYTPSWTNLTVGNATQASAYISAGSLHVVRILLTFGSTTSISGQPEFTLPNGVSMSSAYVPTSLLGTGNAQDANAGIAYSLNIWRSSSTAARARFIAQQVATYVRDAAISSSVPMTWATSDILSGTFVFEAA